MDLLEKLKKGSVVGGFMDYDNWDEPGEKFEIEFTDMQWSIVKYLAYMAYKEQADREEIEDPEMIEKFIKQLIENELMNPKLQGPKIEQPSLFDENNM